VAFVLKDGRLFTIHEEELATIRLFRLRARGPSVLLGDAMTILLSLFTTKVDRLADVLESVYTSLESASEKVLRQSDKDLHVLLAEVAEFEDISGKARLSLLDTQRALNFILRNMKLEVEQIEQVRDVLRDVDSLLPHTAFLFDKVNFLMGAIQGFINIEQNRIIKIFSIAAVVFLPPTLVASIYGMNFRVMPELTWSFGYPLAIVLMVLSGISPYWYFKRRGWL
jgi:magnesium transporter